MTEAKPKRRWFRFSIRDLLWLAATTAIASGWWINHRVKLHDYNVLEMEIRRQQIDIDYSYRVQGQLRDEINDLKIRLNAHDSR